MRGGFASQRDERNCRLDSQNPHQQRPSLAALGTAAENAAREYEERKMKRDQAEQDRMEKDNRERAGVVRNPDGKTEPGGFFASLCEAPPGPTEDVFLCALQCLRGRLAAANNCE